MDVSFIEISFGGAFFLMTILKFVHWVVVFNVTIYVLKYTPVYLCFAGYYIAMQHSTAACGPISCWPFCPLSSQNALINFYYSLLLRRGKPVFIF